MALTERDWVLWIINNETKPDGMTWREWILRHAHFNDRNEFITKADEAIR